MVLKTKQAGRFRSACLWVYGDKLKVTVALQSPKHAKQQLEYQTKNRAKASTV
jgi:hypothetical protein